MKQPFNLNSIICLSPLDASGIGTRKSDVSIPNASEGPPRDEFHRRNSAMKLATRGITRATHVVEKLKVDSGRL